MGTGKAFSPAGLGTPQVPSIKGQAAGRKGKDPTPFEGGEGKGRYKTYYTEVVC